MDGSFREGCSLSLKVGAVDRAHRTGITTLVVYFLDFLELLALGEVNPTLPQPLREFLAEVVKGGCRSLPACPGKAADVSEAVSSPQDVKHCQHL